MCAQANRGGTFNGRRISLKEGGRAGWEAPVPSAGSLLSELWTSFRRQNLEGSKKDLHSFSFVLKMKKKKKIRHF